MKRALFVNVLLLALVLAAGTLGCRRNPQKGITPIPGRTGEPAAAQTAPRPAVPPGPGGAGTAPTTPIGQGNPVTGADPTKGAIVEDPNTTVLKPNGEGVPQAGRETFEGYGMDPDTFANQTIHFDFDSSAIKATERPKLEEVARQLKDKPPTKLLIDGHCDERGTEEYNRALGERRALSAREYLINLGLQPERMRTRSFGEDRPLDAAHNEDAWSKNRRAEFILLLPPKNQ